MMRRTRSSAKPFASAPSRKRTSRWCRAFSRRRAAESNWRSGATRFIARAWRRSAKPGTTRVEVQLHTGRTHQIRVHFSALKHPVVGDMLYGAAGEVLVGKVTLPLLRRNFLHAARLGFAQPQTGAWIEVRAVLPEELRDYLKKLCDAAGESQGRIDAALAGYL